MDEHPKVPFVSNGGGWKRVPWDRVAKVEIGAFGASFQAITNTALKEILTSDSTESVKELSQRIPATPGWLSIPDQLDPGHQQFVRFSRVESVAIIQEIEHPELDTVILSVERDNTIELARSTETQVMERVLRLVGPGQ